MGGGGVGRRAARSCRRPGFEVDPNTVRAWVMEVGDHATALSRYGLHDGQATQVQLDERLALLRAVKAGAVSDTEPSDACHAPPWGLGGHRSGQ